MENTDLKNNLFIQDYYSLINKEFITVLNNIDYICDNAYELKQNPFLEEGESLNKGNVSNSKYFILKG